MLIYILFAALILTLFLIAGKRRRLSGIVLALAFVGMWLIAGLRSPSVGIDTLSYQQFFNYVIDLGAATLNTINPLQLFVANGFENGFKLYTYVISFISTDFTIYLLITYAIISYSFYIYIKRNSQNYLLSFAVFYTIFFFATMNYLRQSLAMAVLLWGFKYIYERKLLKYLLFVALATLIHQASIIMIIPYFMYNKRFTRHTPIVYGAFISVAFLAVGPVVQVLASLNSRYGTYVDKLDIFQLGSFLILGVYLIVLMIAIYLHRNRDLRSPIKQSMKLSYFYLHMIMLAVVVSTLSIRMSGLSRFMEYFMLFSVVSLSYFLHLANQKIPRYSTGLILALILFAYAFGTMLLKPEWLGVVPY